MMSTTSLTKKRRAKFLLLSLSKQTPLCLLSMAFMLLISPGLIVNSIVSIPYQTEYYIDFDGQSILIFIMSLFVMLSLISLNFGFLFSKKSGDVFHALPLTRNELYLIRVSASFIGAFFAMTVSYLCLAGINALPGVKGANTDMVISCYVSMLLGLLLCTVYTSIFAIISGGKFDFAFSLFAINLGIPILIAILISEYRNIAYGTIRVAGSGAYYYLSPYYMATSLVSTAGNIDTYIISSPVQALIKEIVTILIYTAVFIFVALRLFKIRKSETAGEAYSFKVVRFIISFFTAYIGGYLIGAIFAGGDFVYPIFWIFFIIGVILVSIMSGAITSRGWKTVKNSLKNAAVTVIIALLMFAVILSCGLGAKNRVPDENNIKEISLDYGTVTFKDNFETVTKLHKALTKTEPSIWKLAEIEESNYAKHDSLVGSINSVRIDYKLKSGGELQRQYYYVYGEEVYACIIEYLKSEEYRNYLTACDDIEVKLVEASFSDFDQFTITKEELKEVMKLYTEELLNADEDAFYESCTDLRLYDIDLKGNSKIIKVPNSFTKTINKITELKPKEE